MTAMKRQRISAIDNAWLRMDRPSNLMMICGVLIFREKIELARLREVIAERFMVFGRFRQRPVETPAMSFWEADAHFDIDHHVAHTALPGRAGKAELQAFASRLMSTPLDPSRPRWQFHLVDNYEGGSALVARIHHCYADGIALVRVMLSMTDATADGPPAMPFEPRERKRPDPDDVLAQLMEPLSGVLESARRVGGTLVEKGVAIWHDPAKAVALAEKGSALTAELAKLALMAQDSPTRFKGVPGVTKRVAWADPLPLAEVKTIGKALGGSVNDVLLSCVAGAIGQYLHDKGEDPAGKEIRAMVPVNLRPLEEAWRLGNHFGLAPLVLPIGIANPVERVYAVRAGMSELKGSYQPLLAFAVLAVAGLMIKPVQDAILGLFAKKATAVMTNVPGPAKPLQFCGSTIRQTMFWVPASGHIGVGVSILSYAGGVQFGLITDSRLCPDPQAIIERFQPEFDKLLLVTLMLPWSD